MKTYYRVSLQIKEQGTENKIKIKAKKLTEEAMDKIIKILLAEMLDAPRKELLQELKSIKVSK